MTHTPGPWRLSERRDPYSGSPVYSILAEKHTWLADVLAAECESGQANARLMAAAPDLLEVCRIAKGVIQLRNEKCSDEIRKGDVWVYQRLSAAISKATGDDNATKDQ